MRISILKASLTASLALLLGAAMSVAHADAIFESTTGDVRFAAEKAKPANATKGARVTTGSTITTGVTGQTVLRFDDGQAVVLNPNTEFKINNYRFNKADPKQDSVVFELLKGAMRSVSGLIGTRNAQAYALRTPTATIGIRGTDFMIALNETTQTGGSPLILARADLARGDVEAGFGDANGAIELAQGALAMYGQVIEGAVTVASGGATTSFVAGTTFTATSGAIATSIAASSLPGPISTSFGGMSSVTVGTAAGATGAGTSGATGAGASGASGAAGAAGGAGAGVGAAAAGAGAAAAAGLAAAVSGGNQESTSGTTGTTR